jgi:hypothetical protein
VDGVTVKFAFSFEVERTEDGGFQYMLDDNGLRIGSRKHSNVTSLLDEFRRQGFPLLAQRNRFGIVEQPGRNDPCPCGSGEKYKHCCIQRDQIRRHVRKRRR